MTPVEAQLSAAKDSYPTAELSPLAGGAFLVRVPEFQLPPGWSAPTTGVRILLPVGYPFARPDCFWTDPMLRLANGAMPLNTGMNPLPGVAEPLLWFSWHVGDWNPNRDNILTYLNVVRQRFRDPR